MDIVVTIPKSEYKNDDLETEALLKDPEAIQFWVLHRMPRKLQLDDRIYFVKNDRIESSMRFVYDDNTRTKCDVTGRYWGSYTMFMDDLRLENLPFEVKGFQGFRYRWW